MRSARLLFVPVALFSVLGACSEEAGGDDPTQLEGAPSVRDQGPSDEPEPGAGGALSGAGTGGAAGEHAGGAGGSASGPDAAGPEALPDAAAVLEPDAAAAPPLPTCEGEAFVPVNERVTLETAGLHYQGLDGEANPMNAVLVDLRDPDGAIGPGFYDLEGTNLGDCEVCVAGLRGCDPATGRCREVFAPRKGVVEITAIGAVGDRFTATFHGVDLEQVTVDQNSGRSTPVPDGETWCNAGQVIDVEIAPRPVMLGETVSDFSLQNCETEEFVSMHELGADSKALWFIASAGWCSACAMFLPGAIDAMDQIARDLGPDVIKPVIIVGEDADYRSPSLRFCRDYAEHYGTDPGRFYIDHDGTSSFATTFKYIWPYIGADGSFSLPWNALVEGGTFEYFYADRSGESDLNTALNAVLR